MRRLVMVCCAFLGIPSYAVAGPLTGITEIKILVEAPDKDGEACGFSKSQVEKFAASILEKSKLHVSRVEKDETMPYLYLQVTTIRPRSDYCAFSVNADVRTFARVKTNYGQFDGPVSIWHEGGITGDWRRVATRQLRKSIERYTKKFLVDWSGDNP